MRLIDADALPRHGNRGGLVHWEDIEKAPMIDAKIVRRIMFCRDELVGKTITKAEVDGYGVRLYFDDNMIFDFDASDGGYSCWELYSGAKMEVQE